MSARWWWLVVAFAASAVACSAAPSGESTGETGQEITRGGRECSQDSDCSHGVGGLGVICVRSGTYKGTCGDGCHFDDDCPGGGLCDKSSAHWQCDDPLPKLGTRCADDAFCSGDDTEGADDTESLGGSGRVCSARSHQCIIGCHSNDDCPTGARCDTARATSVCIAAGATGGVDTEDDEGAPEPQAPPETGECSPVTYPSGVTLVTTPDAAMTEKYAALNVQSCALPMCFLDLDDLRAPDGTTYDLDVALSDHFTLRELVATEVDDDWSTKVLVDPALIEKLEETRRIAGAGVVLSSGFRSPDHQLETCMSICGCEQCVSNGRGGNRCGYGGNKVTCARNSRHMWGAAADLELAFSRAARTAGFPFVFDEYGGSGPHLHVDLKSCR